MKTILVFAGTRPEIIKMAPIVRELRQRARNSSWRCHFCFSGQHVEIATPFLKSLQVEPDSRLELLTPGQSLGSLTSRAVFQLDGFLDGIENPLAALVQGDTITAFAGALSSFYHKIPVGHVEAGLRTSNIDEPFPEEANRRLISQIARWNFVPTKTARENLLRENLSEGSIFVTGNTGIDSFLWTLDKASTPENIELKNLQEAKLVLITVHRRENFGLPLKNITSALKQLASTFKEFHFILPMHPNPEVKKTVQQNLSQIENFHLIEPLSYGDAVWAIKHSELILSDSGGIQEEAPSLGKPVLVLRDSTERPEAVEYGTSILVGSQTQRIIDEASLFLKGTKKLQLKAGGNPFGNGNSAAKIVDHLLSNLIS